MQEGNVYGDTVFFNHRTFYNILMFTPESGWWFNMYVNNSFFMNTFAYGYIQTALNGMNGGASTISPVDSTVALRSGFGFTVPFTEQQHTYVS